MIKGPNEKEELDLRPEKHWKYKAAVIIGLLVVHLGLLMIALTLYGTNNCVYAIAVARVFVILGSAVISIGMTVLALFNDKCDSIVRFGCLLFAGILISFEILSIV